MQGEYQALINSDESVNRYSSSNQFQGYLQVEHSPWQRDYELFIERILGMHFSSFIALFRKHQPSTNSAAYPFIYSINNLAANQKYLIYFFTQIILNSTAAAAIWQTGNLLLNHHHIDLIHGVINFLLIAHALLLASVMTLTILLGIALTKRMADCMAGEFMMVNHYMIKPLLQLSLPLLLSIISLPLSHHYLPKYFPIFIPTLIFTIGVNIIYTATKNKETEKLHKIGASRYFFANGWFAASFALVMTAWNFLPNFLNQKFNIAENHYLTIVTSASGVFLPTLTLTLLVLGQHTFHYQRSLNNKLSSYIESFGNPMTTAQPLRGSVSTSAASTGDDTATASPST